MKTINIEMDNKTKDHSSREQLVKIATLIIVIIVTMIPCESVKAQVNRESDVKKEQIGLQDLNQKTDNIAIICNGIIDNFSCPPESTIRDTAITNMLRSKYDTNNCLKFLDFDEIPWRIGCVSQSTGFFVHKVVLPVGYILDATLTISLRAANKNDPSSDFISFFQGSQMISASMIRDLPEAGGVWTKNQSATIELDLENLPSSFAFSNVLPHLQDGDIDIVVGNETGVDYVCVNYLRFSIDSKFTLAPEALFNVGAIRFNLRDTIRAYLRNVSSPYAIVDSAKGVIDTLGTPASFLFANASTGNYYIVIKHRNSIETWSKLGGEAYTSGEQFVYDFTTEASQAYGSNMILKDSRYCFYSGDVNQDGVIDATDLSMIDNDATNFVSGYVVTDLSGDYFVDGTDFAIADNNAYNFVSIVRP